MTDRDLLRRTGVCEHGTALDVHCCNCHSGFLFDADSCVCTADLLAIRAESAEPSAEREFACRGCDRGLPVMMLDDDGTRTDISKRPGVPSHAVDDYWWPCPRWQRAAALAPSAPSDYDQFKAEQPELLAQAEAELDAEEKAYRSGLKQTEMCNVIAIVPARKLSKGIPNKNFLPLVGVNPIARAHRCAREAGIPHVVISTDAGGVCLDDHHATTMIRRPPELAQDDTPMVEVVRHVLAQPQVPQAEIIVVLQPSQPLRTAGRVRQAIAMLEFSPKATSVSTVVKMPQECSPDRLCEMAGDWLHLADGRELDSGPTRRQDARPVYRRDGTAYILRRGVLLRGEFYGPRCMALVIPPEESCALDEPADWAEAERRLIAREAEYQRPTVRQLADATIAARSVGVPASSPLAVGAGQTGRTIVTSGWSRAGVKLNIEKYPGLAIVFVVLFVYVLIWVMMPWMLNNGWHL